MKRRLLCLLLTLVMVLGLMPGTALADTQMMFRGMSNDGTGWYEDPENALIPCSTDVLGVGMQFMLRPYWGNTPLTDGTFVSSDSNVITLNQIFDREGLPFYEVIVKNAGTVTLTYTRADNTKYETTLTFAQPDGFYDLSGNLLTGRYYIENNCNVDPDGGTEHFFIYYEEADGMTEAEANSATLSFQYTDKTLATAQPVAKEDNTYRVEITFIPENFVRNAVADLTLTYQDDETKQNVSSTLRVTTATLGTIASGFFMAQNFDVNDLLTGEESLADYSAVWYMTKDGLTEAETKTFTAALTGENAAQAPVDVTFVTRENSSNYDAKLVVETDELNPKYMGYGLTVTYTAANGGIKTDQISGFVLVPHNQSDVVGNYTIAFTQGGSSAPFTNEMAAPVSTVSESAVKGNTYVSAQKTLTVQAYTRKRDDNSNSWHYEQADSDDVQVEILSVRLEPSVNFGDPAAWSLAAGNTQVTRLEASGDPINQISVAHLDGCQGSGAIYATVKVTIGSTAEYTTVRVGYRQTDESTKVISGASMTPALNDQLQELAKNDVGGKTVYYEVRLADNTNYGTIEIPKEFFNQNHRLILTGGQNTCVDHINLNGAYLYGLSGVEFCHSNTCSSCVGTAVYGGYCLSVEDCCFANYDIALESTSAGYISPTQNNLFVFNDVAVSVDAENINGNFNNAPLEYNTYIGNKVAIQVKSIMTGYGNMIPYNFRVSDSNFINNDCDFKFSEQAAGTYYFYRNYFCKWKDGREHNRGQHGKFDDMLTYRQPVIEAGSGTSVVITNTRRGNTVLRPLKHYVGHGMIGRLNHADVTELFRLSDKIEERSYKEEFTLDFERETRILNDEADNLTVPSETFSETTESEEITVLNEDEQVVGTWTIAEGE